MDFTKFEEVSIRNHPELNERWVQDRVAEDPSILGLGDLVLKDRERIQPRAGRLDLLLQDVDSSRRFEVEIQLPFDNRAQDPERRAAQGIRVFVAGGSLAYTEYADQAVQLVGQEGLDAAPGGPADGGVMNFRIPVPVNIAVLVLATTALYTHIGQLVPQTKIMPPEEVVIRDDMTTEELVQVGLEIIQGEIQVPAR